MTRPAGAVSVWRELACALALLAVAIAYFVLARGLRESALADVVGPAGLPLIYAQALAALAVVIGAGAFLRRYTARPSEGEPVAGPMAPSLRRAAGALAIGIGYLLALPLIGYPFAIALLVVAMAVYQGERLDLRMGLIACGGAVVLYVLFDVVLGVSMPTPW